VTVEFKFEIGQRVKMASGAEGNVEGVYTDGDRVFYAVMNDGAWIESADGDWVKEDDLTAVE